MKHAQITLMILMGLILLIAFGLVIWWGTKTATKRTAPEAEHQRLRQVAVQPVRDYVQSCLDITTSNALELLGKQGGVLYQAQGGLTPDVRPQESESFVVYDGLNVSYAIVPPSGTIGQLFFSEPPDYPYRTFPYLFLNDNENLGTVIKTQYEGYFGIPRLAPLLKPGEESIQAQLESFINFNLPRCTEWSTFQQQGLSVAAGIPETTITIAENITQVETEQYFTAHVYWQVDVNDLATGANTTISEFSLGYPVHLARFYLFVKSIVLDDVGNSSFDPRTASDPATPVSVVQDVNPSGGDDLIIVQDRASQLRGKPLEFRILRKNRIPALEWINQTGLDGFEFIPAEMCGISSPNVVIDQGVLSISHASPDSPAASWSAELEAMDPDEDAITFRTLGPAPLRLPGPAAMYRLYVYASDGKETEDYQPLRVMRTGCPP